MYQVVEIRSPDSAEVVTLLEGGFTCQDDADALGEITTWVPECKWYRKLPCSCEHAKFHAPDGSFTPGFDAVWHRPFLQRMFMRSTVRFLTDHASGEWTPQFWHNSALGNFKNGLDVRHFIVASYQHVYEPVCSRSVECATSQAFMMLLNFAFALFSFTSSPAEDEAKAWRDYAAYLEWLVRPQVVEILRAAPWEFLLLRPRWASAFLYVLDIVEGAMLGERAGGRGGGEGDGLRRVLALLRSGGGPPPPPESCFARGWADGAGGADVVQRAFDAAFGEACGDLGHGIQRLVAFGNAVRPLLPLDEEEWASADEASALNAGAVLRLCDGVAHRRAGRAELHVLGADAVALGGEVVVELLWVATSDDQCLMVGASSPHAAHGDNPYYSFLHTLPASHVQHWRCQASLPGEPPEAPADAVTVSYTGFSSVTTCRLPPRAAAGVVRRLEATAAERGPPVVAALDLALVPAPGSGSWSPEALRLCAVRPGGPAAQPAPWQPAPSQLPRLRLAACTAPLHHAERVHSLAPFAMEDWLNYHRLIGVEHFTVYDSDGSYAPYLARFVASGLVTYHGEWPQRLSPKVGLASGERPMLTEPQVLDHCVWSYRQVSRWVIVLHSFEEYLHSRDFGKAWRTQGSVAPLLLRVMNQWASNAAPPGDPRQVAMMELVQEPMGGPRVDGARSVLGTWVHGRGDVMSGSSGEQRRDLQSLHERAFAWIVDPVGVVHTAIHLAHPRANGAIIVSVPGSILRVNHYLDLGSNESRCLRELGGCDVKDRSILWAEDEVIRMRIPG